MQQEKTQFNVPPKKFQPTGISFIHEDKDIIVVDKINGLLTIGSDTERQKTAYFLLNNYVKKGNAKSKNRIFIVHRLDRDTSGVLVFAKNENAKQFLQENWQNFSKKYYAVVHGIFDEKEGVITSYLTENKAHIMYSTKDHENGKLSTTGYKVIKESSKYSLLEITLFTGRKNQIRVHLAEKGHPIVGDEVYGEKDKSVKRLALHSFLLIISQPFTKEKMTFETEIPPYFNTLMRSV
jgi:tRNA pseudouridine32 synthase/23S rRNA pseudouridine746 synthase/23S rRNA pseudouridine1911/1915/1917 synthase